VTAFNCDDAKHKLILFLGCKKVSWDTVDLFGTCQRAVGPVRERRISRMMYTAGEYFDYLSLFSSVREFQLTVNE
jgi:hypothetical protein